MLGTALHSLPFDIFRARSLKVDVAYRLAFAKALKAAQLPKDLMG